MARHLRIVVIPPGNRRLDTASSFGESADVPDFMTTPRGLVDLADGSFTAASHRASWTLWTPGYVQCNFWSTLT
jgi:hypothetical protein